MTEPITIGSAGVKFIKDSNTNGLSFSETYNNAGTSTIYTVPAAHVFWILHCSISAASDAPMLLGSIMANGSKIMSIGASKDGSTALSMDMMVKITAGQTIQFYRLGTSATAYLAASVAGIETDA